MFDGQSMLCMVRVWGNAPTNFFWNSTTTISEIQSDELKCLFEQAPMTTLRLNKCSVKVFLKSRGTYGY